MAKDWSQLPPELLDEIGRRLQSPIYLLRFRSVCSSWRSSAPSRPRLLPGRFPFLPTDAASHSSWAFHLSKRSLLLLSPASPAPPHRRHPWIVKADDNAPPARTQLLNPLSRFQIKPLPESFPKVLDLSRFRVLELGQEFVLHYMHFRPFGNSLGSAGDLYMEKVVFRFLDSETSDFAVLTIHVSGKLAMYKFGDKRWTIIHDMPSPYDDVVLFGGEFYAVDSTGRAVVVDLGANAAMAASPVFGGDKKFLVESSGELLMVDMYLSIAPPGAELEVGEDEDVYERFDEYMGERTVRFKVFRLASGAKKWDEVSSLGDRVLFLGDDCAFSASALDLRGCRNCIFFTDNFFYNGSEEDGVFRGRDIGVYDMESGIIAPLADCPEHSKLFWPPPDWIVSRTAEALSSDSVEANQVQSQIQELAL